MNKNKLLKIVELVKLSSEDIIPKGYYTREELQENMHCKRDKVCRLIKEYSKRYPDKIKVKKFKIRNTSGTLSSVPHYKFLSNKFLSKV